MYEVYREERVVPSTCNSFLQFSIDLFFPLPPSTRTIGILLSVAIIPKCMIQELLKLRIDFFKSVHKQTKVILFELLSPINSREICEEWPSMSIDLH